MMQVGKASKLLIYSSIPIVILTLGIFYYSINPSTFAYTPQCPFYTLTGFHCPGCGTQRALHDILHGHIWAGLQHNFMILLALLAITYKLYVNYINKSGQKTKDLLHHNAAPWIILALIMGFWILRNIPLEPFLILAP